MSDNPFSEIPDDIVKSVLNQSGFAWDSDAPEQPEVPPEAPPEVEPEEEAPPAPGGPLFPPEEEEPDTVTLPDGRKYPVALVKEWADRSTFGTPPPAVPIPPIVEPQQQYPVLPQLTEEDLEIAGPAVRALLLIATSQQQDLKRLAEEVQGAKRVQEQNAAVEANKVISAATSAFRDAHNISEDLMKRIVNNANQDDVIRHVKSYNDPYEAVKYALTRSYWDLPEARQFEFDRQSNARSAAQARKQRLAGVGGSNGAPSSRGASVFDESTPEGRHQAAIELVRQAMEGES